MRPWSFKTGSPRLAYRIRHMQSQTSRNANDEMKHVFVCGLHRSGTTILAQNIGELKNCTGFENTGALMDEGQHLQDIYPPDHVYGGVGKFGFAAHAHLTEHSSLLTPTNISRLRRTWESYWDRDKTIRIEKTPGNLLMTRFLQAAFPNSYFVVIKRHPVPVSLATQKWSRSPLHKLFEHWFRCHEIFDEDKKFLNNLYELSYEDYVESPKKHLEKIANFIGTELSAAWDKGAADVHNKRYFARWAQMLQTSPFRWYYRSVARRYESKFARQGYSLAPLGVRTAVWFEEDWLIARFIAPLLYLGATIYSVPWHGQLRLMNWVHHFVDGYCPPKIRAFLRDCKATLSRRNA
jgi:hypothetical protein